MKKLAVMAALAISAVTFGNVEAATSTDKEISAGVETVEMSHWTQFRDSITGKRERQKEREREQDYYDGYRSGYRGGYNNGYDRGYDSGYDRGHRPPPPPPRYGGPPPRR